MTALLFELERITRARVTTPVMHATMIDAIKKGAAARALEGGRARPMAMWLCQSATGMTFCSVTPTGMMQKFACHTATPRATLAPTVALTSS